MCKGYSVSCPPVSLPSQLKGQGKGIGALSQLGTEAGHSRGSEEAKAARGRQHAQWTVLDHELCGLEPSV